MTEPLKYTESDMRVLTEAALRLGRKEAGEELEASILAMPHFRGAVPREHVLNLVRGLPPVAPDATSGRTDPGRHSDLPPDPQGLSNRNLGDGGFCLFEHLPEVHECCHEVSPCPFIARDRPVGDA